MSKVVAICQSNYIPWKGYFDMINMADVFVLYDDMQYTRRDWRNRNKIMTPSGLQWLTIPVEIKGKYHQRVNETKVSDISWAPKHWARIKQVYGKTKFFGVYDAIFEDLYLKKLQNLEYLSDINHLIIKKICEVLDIETKIMNSKDFHLAEERSERLLGICRELGATSYLSGPAAKDYMDEELFERNGVGLSWMDYNNYPVYEQKYGEFEHGVTILDLLFNSGPSVKKFMKSFL